MLGTALTRPLGYRNRKERLQDESLLISLSFLRGASDAISASRYHVLYLVAAWRRKDQTRRLFSCQRPPHQTADLARGLNSVFTVKVEFWRWFGSPLDTACTRSAGTSSHCATLKGVETRTRGHITSTGKRSSARNKSLV